MRLQLFIRIFTITLLFSFTSEAQSLISGYITDRNSKEAIANVHILSQNNEGTFSDINGFFEINLKEGKHELSFQHVAYKTTTKKRAIASLFSN